jgi:hypothetical protein
VAVRGGRRYTSPHRRGLPHFDLLVDCRINRLLDGVTSLSVPDHAASSLIPSVKTIRDVTPVDSLIAEIPDLTRPTGVKRQVRCNTAHHIRTIPGPPITCRPRRLAPDRLAIVKAEFETMLRDGTARRSESSGFPLYTSCPRTMVGVHTATTEL